MMSQLRGRRRKTLLIVILAVLIAAVPISSVVADTRVFRFDMVRSSAAEAADCLPDASAEVRVLELGAVEVLNLNVSHLAPKTTYSFFVIQVPDKPFGVSWYNGEVETNAEGIGSQRFIARFNEETFAVAPGVAPAPVIHTDPPFPDASTNPAFNPIHTFHLGLWFSDPKDAAKAGCGDSVTPFDGDHVAGIQVLSTKQFPPDEGPLLQVAP